jgi:glyoxylase-like metal-dependent hydrolase (beta-lactamase superfamily II)
MRLVKVLCVTLVLLAAVAVQAQQAEDADPVQVEQLTAGLYRIQETAIFGVVNMVASVGEDGILLVDTGVRQNAEAFKAAVEELGEGPVRVVIITHDHADHFGGNAMWGPEVTVIAHANARRGMMTGNNLLQELPAHALPTVTFDDELTLHFNGEEIDLKHVRPCHSTSDVIVHFTASKVAYIGALVAPDQFPFVDVARGGTPEALADGIRWVLNTVSEDAVLVTGHGRDYTADDLRAYHDMIVDTTSMVEKALARGQDAEAMQEAELLEEWESWAGQFVNTGFWINSIVRTRTPADEEPRKSIIDPLYQVLQEDDAGAAIAEYRRLKSAAQDEYAFIEQSLNLVGYYLLGKERVDEAIAIFKLNVEEYPEGFNTYDSLAEGYMVRGDRELAIEFYTKSLELNPDNQNAVDKLEELGAE